MNECGNVANANCWWEDGNLDNSYGGGRRFHMPSGNLSIAANPLPDRPRAVPEERRVLAMITTPYRPEL